MVFRSHDEAVIHKRGFERFESDDQMVAWLEEKGAFQCAGHRRSFLNFYISNYCMDPIYDFLTNDEVKHLREVQKRKQAEKEAAEAAREWKKVETSYYADNSVEEIWEDKDGNQKTIMTVMPHGDVC